MQRNYSSTFYDVHRDLSARSAEQVVSYLSEILAPRSVLDVGCGSGGWVRAFRSAGATTSHGLDGPWARESGLLIPESDFFEFDFMESHAPYNPSGLLDRYDLVTTFEVVEHLPHELAQHLADFFASKADAVIISCAIPGQGGIHHVNEQWPSYWTKLMNERGYQACDFIRPAIWDKDNVESWYKQNSIGYFKGAAPDQVMQRARTEWESRISQPLDLVHPNTFERKWRKAVPTGTNVLRMTGKVARRLLKTALKRA